MKALIWISGLLMLLVTVPIWYYLLYKILEIVKATELMWFLYWIYLPVGVLALVLKAIVDREEKKNK